jgi:hypothetical protein
VLDLRTGTEVELEGPGPLAECPELRIEHRSLHAESGGRTDLDADTVKLWGHRDEDGWFAEETPIVRIYLRYLRHRPDSVVDAVRAIARADGAVLVHCAAGKDRTGVIVALALAAAGFDRATIVADYMATRERIEEILERLVSSPTYRAELEGHDPWDHAPVPETMERFLEIVDSEFGGAAAWLSAHGLSDEDLERLRRRLRPPRDRPRSALSGRAPRSS